MRCCLLSAGRRLDMMNRWFAVPILFSVCGTASLSSGQVKPAAKDVATQLTFPYSGGWLGADDAYSIPFGQGKSVWLFGDTFVADPSTTLRSKAKTMVRNSIG